MRTTDCHAIHGILIHPNLSRAPEWRTFDPDGLEALRRILGCQWVEQVSTPIPGVSMLVDEEGALGPDAEYNARCSAILYPARIVGPALLTGILPTGERTSLTAQQLAALASRGITAPIRPEHRTDVQWLTREEEQQLTRTVADRINQREAQA